MENKEINVFLDTITYRDKKYISLDGLILSLYEANDSFGGAMAIKDLIDGLKRLKDKKE